MNNDHNMEILPKELADHLRVIEQGISHYWESNKRYNYHIIQGTRHSRKVVQKLINLIVDIDTLDKLTNDEKFIVIASALLCDVGLQSSFVSTLFKPEQDLHPLPKLLFSVYPRRGELAEQVIRNNNTFWHTVGLSTIPNDYINRIADICLHCTPDTFEDAPETRPLNSNIVRIRLLSALLGLADHLYIESSRVDWKNIELAELPINKFAYFWCYHYVQVMPIQNGIIRFSYEIPKEQSELITPIRNLFEGSVKYESNGFVKYLLDNHGCKLIPKAEIIEWSTNKNLPPISVIVSKYLEHPVIADNPHSSPKIILEGARLTSEYIVDDYRRDLSCEEFLININSMGYIKANSSQGEVSSQFPIQIPVELTKIIKRINLNQTTQDIIVSCGKSIFNLIFPKEVYAHYIKTEAIAKKENKVVRLKIFIESGEIKILPIETLFREDLGIFLATDPNSVLARYVELPLPQPQFSKKAAGFNLLLLISNPKDQPPIDTAEWDNHIRNSLAVPIEKGFVKISTVTHVTYENIRDIIFENPPDILQFIGHGFFKNKRGYLALEHSSGNTWLVDDASFADLFLRLENRLRLINLTACDSGTSNANKGFVGLAYQLIQRGFPTVVGMQYPMSTYSAKIFLENFYKNVSAGMPVDWAIQESRKSLLIIIGRNFRDFFTPVLYTRSNGDLFI